MIWRGCLGNGRYPDPRPPGDWRSEMGIPRELSRTTRDGARILRQEPIKELAGLRRQAVEITGAGAARLVL